MNKDTKELSMPIIKFSIICFVVILFNLFLFTNVHVNEFSMKNTLHTGDRLLLSRLNRENITHGDIIVFKNPDRNSDKKLFIKRVIGVEGDTIFISKDNKVYRNSELLDENYVAEENNTTAYSGEWVVPEGHVFVMGDNRDHSYDSRFFGSIPRMDVIGKVIFRISPVKSFGTIQ